MNIILTTRCNKNCSFCFANKVMREKPAEDMTLANFSGLVELACRDNPRPQGLKLLGGEPTMHPQFVEILDFLTARQIQVSLISNLLYEDEKVRMRIYQAARDGVIVGGLANAAELGSSNKMQIFKDNFNALREALGRRDFQRDLAAGITLSRHKSSAEEVAYVEYLSQNLEISALRISLDFLGDNVRDTFFINNKEYGQKFLAVIHKCLDLRIPASGDCKMYPCMFEPKNFRKDIQGFIQRIRTACLAGAAPFDVLPDMSYIHCYPARKLSGQNILKFSHLSEALGEITFLKKSLQSLGREDLPPECRVCDYYKTNRCDSLCLGCRELAVGFLDN
ncbi:molybdenum cofactor biosynthesis protein A [Candidatus Termititenax aidoneus]|uniref:Molybdenum cofactor biosynthesis protein A n=1 Tax=Termititenax aidoneus TaxID=2218524 RepID=A0A388T9G5_TERA1|nr:molybdenum cofactor biosynthesis protein A [Candidatus Termititenax aidoneus]